MLKRVKVSHSKRQLSTQRLQRLQSVQSAVTSVAAMMSEIISCLTPRYDFMIYTQAPASLIACEFYYTHTHTHAHSIV